MELKCLTTREVARLCRVSDATVKRWQAAGLLHSERTSGGHRRFRHEEIARFRREHGNGNGNTGDESIVKAMTRRLANKHNSECSLFYSLVAGCEEEAANQIIGAHLDGKQLAEIFDEMICPAMRRVGELWYSGELNITQEHIASRTASAAIYRLRSVLPAPKSAGKLAMCCAVEGDFHELPTHLAQTIFESEGWEVLNFGANTPLYCLAEEAARHAPALICIAATVITDVERLARDYKIFAEQTGRLKTSIVFGGRAFADAHIRQRFPNGLFVRSFAEVVRLMERLATDVR